MLPNEASDGYLPIIFTGTIIVIGIIVILVMCSESSAKRNINRSSEKCKKSLDEIKQSYIGNGIERFLKPGGYNEFEECIDNIIKEYDRRNKDESMSTQVKHTYLAEDVIGYKKKIIQHERILDKRSKEEVLKAHDEWKTELKQMYNVADKKDIEVLGKYYGEKIKLLMALQFDKASEIDKTIQRVKENVKNKPRRGFFGRIINNIFYNLNIHYHININEYTVNQSIKNEGNLYLAGSNKEHKSIKSS